MSVNDTYILAISLAWELGMTLAYSYLLPSPSGPSRVLQRGRSPVPPTLLLLFAHTVLTIFYLGFETLLKFGSALTPRRLCLLLTAPPRAQLWPHRRGGIRHLPRVPLLAPSMPLLLPLLL